MATSNRRAPLIGATKRAFGMALGGVVGGLIAAALVVACALTFADHAALVSCLTGIVAVIIFYVIGQLIEIGAHNLRPVPGMSLVLASYVLRVAGITAALWGINTMPWFAARLEQSWLGISVIVTTCGWISGMMVIAMRQRVPIYDSDDV